MRIYLYILFPFILLFVVQTVHPQCDTLNLGNDTIMCDGAVLQLNAGAGYDTYLWNNDPPDNF
ncbi:MAG: hypothetical protein R2764_12055 [Bacteroidales bacterium]